MSEATIKGIKPWILATRPKTLTAAVIPVLVASAVASQVADIDWSLGFCALIASLFIQIGTNLINDALDFKRGADTQERLGPLRATQMGWLKPQQVLAGGCASFFLAVLFSIPLVMQGGVFLLGVLALSIACGYLYTGGPRPLAYVGLGDVFVLLFYGWIGTLTMFYIYTGEVSYKAFLAGTQIGLLCTSIIAVNNFRDMYTDAKANKQTLAVRFGETFSRFEILFLMAVPYVLSFVWLTNGSPYAAMLTWLTLPLATHVVSKLWTHNPSPLFNQFFALTCLHYLLFGLLLAIGLVM